MQRTRNTRNPQTIILLVAAVAWFGLALHAMTGCSTVSGAAGLMRGIAQDVEDAAEGARERMAQE
jgi:hypothetical protein